MLMIAAKERQPKKGKWLMTIASGQPKKGASAAPRKGKACHKGMTKTRTSLEESKQKKDSSCSPAWEPCNLVSVKRGSMKKL